MIRCFDIFLAVLGIIILLPMAILIAIWIKIDSSGPVIYRQQRIGLNGKPFGLLKFRTMQVASDKKGMLTVGNKDSRITRAGYFLRKYKMDELPQLVNVLLNEMSFVGPRPEVKKYVDLYSAKQKKVLSVKPGITDYASIVYRNENEILASASNPEEEYVHKIMPHKISLNLTYIRQRSLRAYLAILFKTIFSIFRS